RRQLLQAHRLQSQRSPRRSNRCTWLALRRETFLRLSELRATKASPRTSRRAGAKLRPFWTSSENGRTGRPSVEGRTCPVAVGFRFSEAGKADSSRQRSSSSGLGGSREAVGGCFRAVRRARGG